jgi:hypothetical protein
MTKYSSEKPLAWLSKKVRNKYLLLSLKLKCQKFNGPNKHMNRKMKLMTPSKPT